MSVPFTRCLPFCIARYPGRQQLEVLDRDYQRLAVVERGLGPKMLQRIAEGHVSYAHGEFWYLRPTAESLSDEEWSAYLERLRVLRRITVDVHVQRGSASDEPPYPAGVASSPG